MEELQSNTIESAAPSEVSSAPVSDTASSSAASAETSGGLTDDKLTASLSAVYDRASAREGPASNTQNESAPTPTDSLPLPPFINGRMSPDTWAAMPQEARELFLAREQEAQAKISQYGREVAQLKAAGGTSADAELSNVIGRYANHIPRGPDGNQMAPQAVLETLLQAHLALEQNPAAAIAHLANSYGIDWKSVGLDPRLEAQRQGQLHQARQQAAMLQQQHQQWQSQRQQYLQKEIESLITGKEHWSEIENETMVQLNAMRQQNPRLAEADLELYVERSSL